MFRSKGFLCYFAIGLLILGLFIEEAGARRKILRGRKTITRRYYRGTAIPAWSIVLLTGIGMLLLGSGLFLLLQKFIIDAVDKEEHGQGETRTVYQPALQSEA